MGMKAPGGHLHGGFRLWKCRAGEPKWLDLIRRAILEALRRMGGARKKARKKNLNKDSKQSSMKWLETQLLD